MIERSGQGVDKIYYNNLAEGKSLPDYSESDAYQVVLKLKAEIVDTFIMDNQPVNARGIADILKIPLGTVYRILGFLSSKEVGLVEHIGSKKTGGYQLTVKGNSL